MFVCIRASVFGALFKRSLNYKLYSIMKAIRLFICLIFLSATLSAQIIHSFAPTSAIIGSTVTIVGEGFSAVPNQNSVTFNGTSATVLSATESSLTLIVPNGATSGPVSVTVNGNTVLSSSIFTVTETNLCNTISSNNAKNWYFGNQAALKFENNVPVAMTNSAMTQVEGVATMSDSNGNLLFYTNGITVYNRNHEIMVNGTGLLSHSSNTQAAFIVPFAGNENKYYLITPDPYYYSVVDMSLDNGNGAIEADSKNTLLTNERSEKVAGVLASNEQDIWLITYGVTEKRFNVFKIDSNGVSSTPVTSEFDIASGYFGYMKISPDGTKIAMANFTGTFHLYDFNNVTGQVSNQKVIEFTGGGFGSYGIEFSPNGQLIYVADHRGQHKVIQYDITQATPELIAASGVALEQNTTALGALQLGLDNKIYVAREGSGSLGVINNPNSLGESCGYVQEGFGLNGKTSNLGLPGFVASSLVYDSPYINSFSPESGQIGSKVTINGTGFSTNLENNVVMFNGVAAEVISATQTQLSVIVPTNATTGKISLEVGCAFVATTDDFVIETMGVNDSELNQISIYPNPTMGKIFLSKSVKEVSIYNLSGQKMPVVLDEKSLDLSGFASGIYIIRGMDGNQKIFERKVIKK